MEDSIAKCLTQIHKGEPGAEARLPDAIYEHLRKMAGNRMRRERNDHTLQPTALVNEVWLKLVRAARMPEVADNEHFYGICGRIMRNVLVDHARHVGPGTVGLELAPGLSVSGHRSEELLALDAALDRLARFDTRGAQVIELIFFLGFTRKEAAGTLKTSERTVKRDYATCMAWLRNELRNELRREPAVAGALP